VAAGASYEELLARHEAEHRVLFDRCRLDLAARAGDRR
jgi:hypothetical protein